MTFYELLYHHRETIGLAPVQSFVTMRYMYSYKREDGNMDYHVVMVTGLPDLHDRQIAQLIDDPNVTSCVAEYVCSYDSDLAVSKYILKEDSNNEKV